MSASRRTGPAAGAVAGLMLTVGGLACAAAVLAMHVSLAGAAPSAPVQKRSPASTRSVSAGDRLPAATSLVSPDGRVRAEVGPGGRLVVAQRSRRLWSSPAVGPGAHLAVTRSGSVALVRNGIRRWTSPSAFPGATWLALRDDGTLTLQSRAGTVWTSGNGTPCTRLSAGHGHEIDVDLSAQHAWFCNGATQVLTTPVTTGAAARGRATPTGSFRIRSEQRDQTLHPVGGGAYFVHYWLPYHGAYGLHDSSWQRFPYGSRLYRTRGSHGCVHVPRAAIAFLYEWAQRGTRVTIRR